MSYKYFLVLSFLCVVEVLLADQKLCNELKPCGDRGVCGRSSDEASKHLLTIKCFCRYNYTGQWCQYVDDKYQPGPKDKVPGKPKILTDTKVPNYNQKYFLKFKGVKDPPRGKVLYYLLRYTDVTTSQGEWRSVAVKNKGGVHKVLLDKSDWGHKYKLELYAGNTHGLGEPGQRTLKRPKVSEPKIVDVSEDLTGSNTVCCGKPLTLQCKAKGRPQPTYSWYFNGIQLRYAISDVVVKDGTLTISEPSYKEHQGEYRCLASNAWGTVLSRPVQVEILAPGRSVKLRGVKNKARSFSHTSLPHQILYQETNLTMNCGKRKEANHVTWFYNGIAMRIPGRRKDDIGRVPIDGHVVDIQYKLHQGRLQLINTKPIATGIYQCDVTVKDDLVSMTRYVQFRDFDHIEPLSLKHKSSDEVRLKKGSTATLTCLPTPSDTVPIIWKNLSRKTEERSRKLPNGSLEIRDISQSESTLRITCEFSSDQGVSAKRSIGIHVAQSVNGGWSSWGSWQSCRGKDCVRPVRFRKCNNPAPRYDGRYCPGPDAEESDVWSGWSAWVCIPISAKCGKHVKIRTRTCQGVCPGKARQTKSCSLYIPCPVNGSWSRWSRWSACTKSCYPGGTQSRVRKCKPPKHGGKTCSGKSKLTRRCNTNAGPCPINGGWSSWSSWTQCSTTCNAGVQSRAKNCTNPVPKHGGEDCQGTNTMTKKCMLVPCKVDGGWSAWSDFSACSVSCGAGVKYSTRICNNPREEHGGKECDGNSQYRTQCDMPPCKVDGGWSTWGTWSECSTTCSTGVISRVRNCSDPEPKYGGQDCEGENDDEKTCHMIPCPVNGRWSPWSKWSSCSVTCDSGLKTRIRSCTRPEPTHGGNKCHGKHEFKAKCHQKRCKGIKGEGLPDVKLAKKNSGSSSNNSNAMIYTFVGGIGGLVLLVIMFCSYRAWYLRSQSKDYMPLTKVKTQPVAPKSILKNKRESTAPASSELPSKSTKRSSVTSDTSGVPSKTVKRGSLPPPPPPLPVRSASQRPTRGKRRPGGKTRSTDSKKDTPEDGTVGFDETALEHGKAALQSGKAKDMPVHKTSKDSGSPNVPNSPPVSSSTPKGPTPSDDNTLEKAVLESGKVKDANVHVTEGSPNGDKIDLAKVGNAKDNHGQNVVKRDSSSLFVPKRPSEPPAVPSGPSVESSKSGKSMGSEDIYGGLIGFENAILGTGDDQINMKKAMIQKIKSKSKPKKTED